MTKHSPYYSKVSYWLESNRPVSRDYPQAFQQFQQDPEIMLRILFAYGDLINFIKVKRTLAFGLRYLAESYIPDRQSHRKIDNARKFKKVALEAYNKERAFIKQYDDLKSTTNDDEFIRQYTESDRVTVYTEFVGTWNSDFYPRQETKVRREICWIIANRALPASYAGC